MKTWFAKLRWSAALDTGKAVSASLRQTFAKSAELRQFERDLTALDGALKSAAVPSDAPPNLHRSIMRAVGDAEPLERAAWLGIVRWAPVGAAAMVALLAVWWTVAQPRGQVSEPVGPLSAATSALNVGGEMARRVPAAAVAPLSEELARFNRDLDQTTQYLLASLP